MSYIGNSPTQGAITGGNIVDGSIESIDLATLTNIDINSGSIDGTVIGASVASTGEFTEVSLGDNDKIKLGASDDLEIYHDGTDNRLNSNAGSPTSLVIDSPQFVSRISETMPVGMRVGADTGGLTTSRVDLYHWSDASTGGAKLITTSTGVDVTGTVQADGLTVDGVARVDGDITIGRATGSYVFTETDGGSERAGIHSSSLNDLVFKVNNQIPAIKIDGGTRDVSFYEDTGTTAKFVWDASAESLGIGTSSPSEKLDINGGTSYPKVKIQASTQTSRFMRLGMDSATEHSIEANGSSTSLLFKTVGTERARIDSSGNLGIGTSSPSAKLDVVGDIKLSGEVSKESNMIFSDTVTRYDFAFIGNRSANPSVYGGRTHAHEIFLEGNNLGYDLVFNMKKRGAAGGVGPDKEAMRIDESGNLLVGKTSTNFNTDGFQAFSGGFVHATATQATANSGTVLTVNRKSTDGSIVDFKKDGSTVGSIGSYVGVYPVFSGPTFSVILGSDDFVPGATDGLSNDNTIKLGNTSRRWSVVYSATGSINTSDINEKQDIEVLDEAEQRVALKAKTLLRKFRWKDAVAEKGDDARIHFGIMAQDLQQAFADEGLDARRYAMFCVDTWTDEETGEERTRLGVRYSELLAFIIATL